MFTNNDERHVNYSADDDLVEQSSVKNAAEEDNDEVASQDVDLIVPDIARQLFIYLDDGAKINYYRVPHALCNICNSVHCQTIEEMYFRLDRNCSALSRWCKENNLGISYESIYNHFKKHCIIPDKDAKSFSILSDVERRKKLIDRMLENPLEYCERMLFSMIIDINYSKEKKDPKNFVKVMSTILDIIKTIAIVEKTRSQIEGSDSRARIYINTIKNKVKDLLTNIMEISTEDQRKEISRMLQEFRNL